MICSAPPGPRRATRSRCQSTTTLFPSASRWSGLNKWRTVASLKCGRCWFPCGSAGVTSAPFAAGVRINDSIHKLRHRHGIVINTERVGHGGIFAGEHAIYRLSSSADLIELVRADQMRARKIGGRRDAA